MVSIGQVFRGVRVISVVIDIPTRPGDIAGRFHNLYVKQALFEALRLHHKKNIPLHFAPGAPSKYGYAKRSFKYNREKQRKYGGNAVDLVKTGASREHMTHNMELHSSGAAEGSKKPVSATLRLRFPFKGGAGRYKSDTPLYRTITIDQMRREMQAMTDQERAEFAGIFWRTYWGYVQRHRSKRKRSQFSRPAAWGDLGTATPRAPKPAGWGSGQWGTKFKL